VLNQHRIVRGIAIIFHSNRDGALRVEFCPLIFYRPPTTHEMRTQFFLKNDVIIITLYVSYHLFLLDCYNYYFTKLHNLQGLIGTNSSSSSYAAIIFVIQLNSELYCGIHDN